MAVILSRRRAMCVAGLIYFLLPACKAKSMTITTEAVLFSYLDRPIFEVTVGTIDLGVSSVYPYTGGSTTSGAQFSSGEQSIHWRLDGPPGTPRNGETVQAKNRPILVQPPHGEQFLAVHIYPDDTVELLYSKHYPQFSPRGLKFVESRR
jgi:hypothetical protein